MDWRKKKTLAEEPEYEIQTVTHCVSSCVSHLVCVTVGVCVCMYLCIPCSWKSIRTTRLNTTDTSWLCVCVSEDPVWSESMGYVLHSHTIQSAPTGRLNSKSTWSAGEPSPCIVFQISQNALHLSECGSRARGKKLHCGIFSCTKEDKWHQNYSFTWVQPEGRVHAWLTVCVS